MNPTLQHAVGSVVAVIGTTVLAWSTVKILNLVEEKFIINRNK